MWKDVQVNEIKVQQCLERNGHGTCGRQLRLDIKIITFFTHMQRSVIKN